MKKQEQIKTLKRAIENCNLFISTGKDNSNPIVKTMVNKEHGKKEALEACLDMLNNKNVLINILAV